MWPMLFVVIACGAISGFHSLVSSGTTSKQLARARDAKPIGYGAMIMESALAVLAVIAVTAGLHWKTAPTGEEGYIYQDLMKEGGWILTFGKGYGRLTQTLFFGNAALASLVGITMLKTFVMTTLDSATRITRYVCAELIGDTFGLQIFNNRYVATLVVGVCAGALALGDWKAIWPVFGSANQLIAGMVLLITTVYLLSRGRRWQFAAVPAVLVFVTAMGALVYGFLAFAGKIQVTTLPPSRLLAGIAVVLIALGVFVAFKGALAVWAALRGGAGVTESVEPTGAPAKNMPKGPGC
jgi:carbon starvation protein